MGKGPLWTSTTGFAKNFFTVFSVLSWTPRLNMGGLRKSVTLGNKSFYHRDEYRKKYRKYRENTFFESFGVFWVFHPYGFHFLETRLTSKPAPKTVKSTILKTHAHGELVAVL